MWRTACVPLVLALTSCNQWVRPNPPPPLRRTVEDQRRAAVEIRVECGPFDDGVLSSDRTGTGVMVSDWQVLTATHVVDCPVIPTIRITTADGTWRMVVQDEWRMSVLPGEEDGVSRLQLASADTLSPRLAPPRIAARPNAWDPLFIEAAMPEHAEKIGDATGREYGGSSYGGYFFTYDAWSEPGFSGSGVYDAGGDLVGIHLGHWARNGLKYGAYVDSRMVP